MGLPAAALAQGGAFGPPRKFIWVPQALGDWDMAFQVGARDFCEMVGWEYQRIGNPVYSVQNHAEQVNNAIAAQAERDRDLARERRPGAAVRARPGPGHRDDHHGSGHPGGGGRARPAHHQPGRVQCRHPQRHPGRDLRPRADRQERRASSCSATAIPGSTSIDKRQNGSQLGIEQYNAANGTTYQFEAFPDSSFGELTESIQKWTAQIDQKGDALVAAIGTGNPNPIVQALKERGIAPGTIAVGSTDIPPAHQQQITEGWVQWGIDQQFYVMGFMCAAGAWVQLERGYPYLDIRTGGEVVLDKDLERVEARTDIWLAKAREYGFA